MGENFYYNIKKVQLSYSFCIPHYRTKKGRPNFIQGPIIPCSGQSGDYKNSRQLKCSFTFSNSSLDLVFQILDSKG